MIKHLAKKVFLSKVYLFLTDLPWLPTAWADKSCAETQKLFVDDLLVTDNARLENVPPPLDLTRVFKLCHKRNDTTKFTEN